MALPYFGNEQAVSMTEQFLMQFGKPQSKKAILYVGDAGAGKTYLTAHLADKYGVFRELVNASDERKGAGVKRIIQTISRESRDFLMVLDECETMKTKDLERIINATKIPLFLCCNFIEDVEYSVRNLCTIVKVERANWWNYKEYMIYHMRRLNIDIPNDIDERAKKARSYRHAERLIDDPDDIAPEAIENEYKLVERLLNGEELEHIDMKPDDLMNWVNDNTFAPELISNTDIILKRAHVTGYHNWAYAYALLSCARKSDKKPVEFPRSFIMMSKIKKEYEERKKKPDAANTQAVTEVKIDVSKIDMSAVQTGKSLFDGLDDLDFNNL